MRSLTRLRRTGVSAALALALIAAPWRDVYAHHSATSFDSVHLTTLRGVVKAFRWGNPHTWVDVMVPNVSGGTDEWNLESNAVNVLLRQGWTVTTLKPGMKVAILIAQNKDGMHTGRIMTVLDIDGQPFQPTPLRQ